MTKYQSSIDGLQRILDEYPGTQHGFDYLFLSEEESKTIIREARDRLIAAQGEYKLRMTTPPPSINVYYDKPKFPTMFNGDQE